MADFSARENVDIVRQTQELVSEFLLKLYNYTYGNEWYLMKGEKETSEQYDTQHYIKFLAYDTVYRGGRAFPKPWQIFTDKYSALIPDMRMYRKLLVSCLHIRNTVTGHQSAENLNNAEGFDQFLKYAETFTDVLMPFRNMKELYSPNGISYYEELQQLLKRYVAEDRFDVETIKNDLTREHIYISTKEILGICVEKKYIIYGNSIATSDYDRLLEDLRSVMNEQKKGKKRAAVGIVAVLIICIVSVASILIVLSSQPTTASLAQSDGTDDMQSLTVSQAPETSTEPSEITSVFTTSETDDVTVEDSDEHLSIIVSEQDIVGLSMGHADMYVNRWFSKAVERAENNDYDAFSALYGDLFNEDIIFKDFEYFKTIASGERDYTYKIVVVSGTDVVIDLFYFRAFDNTNSSSSSCETIKRYFTVENRRFIPAADAAEELIYLYNQEKILNAGEEYKNGFINDCYWVKYNKALLPGLNLDVQKAVVNDDGSLTAVIIVANGYDHNVYDISLKNNKGDTVISFSRTKDEMVMTIDLVTDYYEGTLRDIHNVTIGAKSTQTFIVHIPAEYLPKDLTNDDLQNRGYDFHLNYNP